MAYVVANSRSRMLFSSAANRQVAEAAAAMTPQLERKLITGPGDPPPGWESYDAAVAGYPDKPVPDESLGAAMLYSSGTTGQPKGILRDLPEIAPSEPLPVLDFVQHVFGFREGMTYLSPAPLYHSAPQASVSGALRLGATAVVMEHFDPEQWLALVERYRVTHCQMVPVMFSRLLRLPEEVRARYDTSSLECVVHAAAPCPVPVKKAMIDWLGPIVTEYYGATEANGFTFCDSAQWVAHPGTVGRPVLGELLILDDEGKECPAGADGTIWFRGATAFAYFADPVKTAEGRTGGGAASTVEDVASTVGDVGHVDADGYLYLTDRKSYMIISGGVNIYPQETENLLAAHPAVLDVAVIGVPNEDLGEEVKAVVQPADLAGAGPDLADRALQVPEDRRLRARPAAVPHQQAVQAGAAGGVLGRPPDPDRVASASAHLDQPAGDLARRGPWRGRDGRAPCVCASLSWRAAGMNTSARQEICAVTRHPRGLSMTWLSR